MDFQIGDRVIIKSWEEMVEEFGLDLHGSINCDFRFLEDMKFLCGKSGTIVNIEDSDEGKMIYFDEEELDTYGWIIGKDMVMLIE